MNDYLSIIIAVAAGLGIGWLMVRNQGVDYSRISVLSKKDFLDNMRKGQLIDIRKKVAYEEDKIKGARNFSVGSIASKHSKLRFDQPVYLYCQNGKKSRKAARKLIRNNYKQVYVLDGGFEAYKAN